jgi:Tol biopolymer transport system component
MSKRNAAIALATILLAAWPWGQPTRAADEGFLVLRRGNVLEAMRPNGSQRQVLRRKFSVSGRSYWYDNREQNNWNISRDGRRVCFTAKPQDIGFFSARAARDYLFVLEHNKPAPQVFLRAYGEKSSSDVPDVTGLSYGWPSFDTNGKKILVTEVTPDEYTIGGALTIHDIATRAQMWQSDALANTSALLMGTAQPNILRKRLYGAALSPNGHHVLCAATSITYPGTDGELSETDFKHYLVHFDLQKPSVDMLASFDQNIQGINWHPDSRRFVLSASSKGDSDIFVGARDEPLLKQLTHSASHDFDPVWNRSGTRLFWLSDRIVSKARANRLFSMSSDGTLQRAELPAIKSIDSLRWAATIPSWRRYREKQVFAAVGIKK